MRRFGREISHFGCEMPWFQSEPRQIEYEIRQNCTLPRKTGRPATNGACPICRDGRTMNRGLRPPGTTSRGIEAKPSPPDPVRKPQVPTPHRSASEARTRPPKTSAPAKKRAPQRLPSFTPKTFSLRRAPFSETNQPTRSGRKCAQSV